MASPVYARPILPLAGALSTGIAIGAWAPGHRLPAFGLIPILLALFIFRHIRGGPIGRSPLPLFSLLGYLSIQPWMEPLLPENHIRHYANQGRYTVTGTVSEVSTASAGRLRLYLETEELEQQVGPIPVTGRIQVTLADAAIFPVPGDRVRFAGRIRIPRNYQNPGAFDYRRHLAFQNILATSYADGLTICAGSKPSAWRRTLENIRRRVSSSMDQAVSGPANPVLKALVIGDTGGLPQELRDTFNRTGTGHLLAISGLNVGMVAMVSLLVFRHLLSIFPPLLWRAWTLKGAALLTLFPVIVYGFIAGMSPSTQRAVIMGCLFLAAVVVSRARDSLNTLGVAVAGILIWHPPALFSISVQLSVMSVVFIIVGLPPKNAGSGPVSSIGSIAADYLWNLIRVTVVATLGVLPLVMYYFNSISLVGVPVNLVAVPIAGGVVVALGLFSAVALFVWHPLGVWGFKACGALLDLSVAMIEWAASWPFSAVDTFAPNGFEIALYYVTLACALNLYIERENRKRRSPGPANEMRRKSRERFVWAILMVSAVAWVADTGYWVHRRYWRMDLLVSVLDVGQGTSVLLEFPGGPVALVDGGGLNDNAVFDIGRAVLGPYLSRNKIRTVDTVLLSHPNADHLNGLLYVLEHFNVGRFWSNGQRAHTAGYRKLIEILDRKGIHAPSLSEFDGRHQINGVVVDVLHPRPDTAPWEEGGSEKEGNNHSLVLKVTSGEKSLLLPGDIESAAEAELSRRERAGLAATLLVSPHHGSRTSSTADFLAWVRPRWVIVSHGENNRFGFPAREVMERYRAIGAEVLTTAEDGAVFIRMNDGPLQIGAVRGGPPRP